MGLSQPSGASVSSKWIKDNIDFSTAGTINITQEGTYRFVAVAGSICPDTSIVVNIKYLNPDFNLSTSYLEFDADNSPEQEITITNNSDEDLVINKDDITITPSANFKLLDPVKFPLIVPKKSQKIIKLKFELVGFGEKEGRITLRTVCSFNKFADLKGFRVNVSGSRLDPDNTIIDFGLYSSQCLSFPYPQSKLTLKASGQNKLIVFKPEFSTNIFTYESGIFSADDSVLLNVNGSIICDIKLASNTIGQHFDTLKIKYLNEGSQDTAYTSVNVSINIFKSELSLNTKEIDFSGLISCKTELDTFLIISNDTHQDIIINNDFSDSRINIDEPLPIILTSKQTDTIKIKIITNVNSEFFTEIPFNNPCLLSSERILIKPPLKNLEISFAKDTVDFSLINNCEIKGDAVITTLINANGSGAKIGNVIYAGTFISSNIIEDKQLFDGNNPFEIKLLSNAVGSVLDSIVFLVEPCNQQYVLYVKGERVNPLDPLLSKSKIDFGQDFLFNAEKDTLVIINNNPGLNLTIDSIEVPDPFRLLLPVKADFPITIGSGKSESIEIIYNREETGTHDLILKIHSKLPCLKVYELIISGSAVDNRVADIKAFLPAFESIELGTEKRLPVTMLFDDKFNLSEMQIQNIKFFIDFDYLNLNIRSAQKSTAYNSPSSILNFDDSKNGKLVLTLNISEPDKLSSGDILTLTVKPLLGNSLKAKIILDSVTINSKIPSKIETNETEITIFGDCVLDGRLLTVDGALDLKVNSVETGSNLNIEYSIVSDEKTILKIYNFNGELMDTVLENKIKPGTYNIYYDSNDLPSGAYIFTLENGIRRKYVTAYVLK